MAYIPEQNTLRDFIAAAASYFGVPVEKVIDGTLRTEQGIIEVVLHVELTGDDLVGIAGRMKAMAEEPVSEPAPASDQAEVPSREQLREQYNALDKRVRSGYGSFHNYCMAHGTDDPYAAPEVVAKVELPPHVYLTPGECTAQQRAMAIGQDEKGRYAIAVEDLTEEQRVAHGCIRDAVPDPMADITGPTADQMRQAYVERTMAAHARLNGADGKPTSNADDFGGLPG